MVRCHVCLCVSAAEVKSESEGSPDKTQLGAEAGDEGASSIATSHQEGQSLSLLLADSR